MYNYKNGLVFSLLLMLNLSSITANADSKIKGFFDIDTKLCVVNATPDIINIAKIWAIDDSDWTGNFLPKNLINQSVKGFDASCWSLDLAGKVFGQYQFNMQISTPSGQISWKVSQNDALSEINESYAVLTNETDFYLTQKAGDNNGFATNVFILEENSVNASSYLSDWMSKIPDHYSLKDIQLIGTHDAGVNIQDGVSCNAPQALAVAQKWNLSTQLTHGIRYFDIRLEQEGELHYPYHKTLKIGCSSKKSFETSLQEMIEFIKHHETEFVLVKISHTAAPIKGVMDMLDQWTQSPSTGKYFYKSPVDTHGWADKKANELRGKIILLLDCEFNAYLDSNKGYFGYSTIDNGGCSADDDMKIIYDKYSNTLDFDYMYRDQLDKLAQHGNDQGSLFLLSWTMTGGDIVAHTPRPAATLAALSKTAFGVSLPSPNIIYYDFEDVGINRILVENYLFRSHL